MKKLKLTNGNFTTVDDDIYDVVCNFNWQEQKGYARRSVLSSETHYSTRFHLSHIVMNFTKEMLDSGLVVDHINFNKLDNTRENLRIISKKQNSQHVNPKVTKIRRQNISKLTAIAASMPRTNKQLEHASNIVKFINDNKLNVHIGINNYASKCVINIITGEEFSCIREAAQKNGLVYSTLKCRLNGGLKNNTNLRIKV